MALKVARLRVTGSAQVKTGNLGGLLHKLRVLYTGAPSGCDVVIKLDGDTITTLTDNNANKTMYPVAAQTDNVGDPLTSTGLYSGDQWSVHLASGDADTVVAVEAFYFE